MLAQQNRTLLHAAYTLWVCLDIFFTKLSAACGANAYHGFLRDKKFADVSVSILL